MPIDLLIISGSISDDFEMKVIDANVEELSRDQVESKVISYSPDYLICLSSILTAKSDLGFIGELKKRVHFAAILMGDIVYQRPHQIIADDRVDAVLLQFPSAGLNSFLNRKPGNHPDVIYKDRSGNLIQGDYSKSEASFGQLKYELFPIEKYRYPLMQRHPFVPVITNLSCPHTCSYCPVQGVVYRKRNMAELFNELDYLKKLNIKELMIGDLMFNADVNRSKEICRQMISTNLNFSWTSLMRPESVDEELISLAKRAGCHTISFGVETTSESILVNNSRKSDSQKIKSCLSYCDKYGIKSLVIVLLGLPGETMETAMETISFVCDTKATFLSVNIFTKRVGSKYMDKMDSLEEIFKDHSDLDSDSVLVSNCDLTTDQLKTLRRTAYLKFYCNPTRIFRILSHFRSLTEILEKIRSGLMLFSRT